MKDIFHETLFNVIKSTIDLKIFIDVMYLKN